MKQEEYNKELGPEMNWTCGFSPEGPLECLREATQHGFIIKHEGETYLGLSMMASCDEHKDRMKADYVHEMKSPCGIAGSRFVWPENYCYFDWDTETEAFHKVTVQERV